MVIDPDPRRHGPGAESERLRLLEHGEPEEILLAALAEGSGSLGDDPSGWRREPRLAFALPRFGEGAWRRAIERLSERGAIVADHGRIAPPEAERPEPSGPQPIPDELRAHAVRALAALKGDGAEPRSVQALADELGIDRATAVMLLDALAADGRLRRLTPDVYFDPEVLATLERRAVQLATERGSISLAELRDELRTSRKYAQALVEHLDREGLTVRRGDRHLARRAPGAG